MKTTMNFAVVNLITDFVQKIASFTAKTDSVILSGSLSCHNYPQSWFTEGREYDLPRARSSIFNKEVPVS